MFRPTGDADPRKRQDAGCPLLAPTKASPLPGLLQKLLPPKNFCAGGDRPDWLASDGFIPRKCDWYLRRRDSGQPRASASIREPFDQRRLQCPPQPGSHALLGCRRRTAVSALRAILKHACHQTGLIT